MDRSDPYDMYVVIPDGCQDWIRLDYFHDSASQADREAMQQRMLVLGTTAMQMQFFMRFMKHGNIPYLRVYFKNEDDAALFKLTFSHLRMPDKSRC